MALTLAAALEEGVVNKNTTLGFRVDFYDEAKKCYCIIQTGESQIYANIMQDRRQTGWIQGKTLPPEPAIRMAAELKAESMKRYGRPAEEVDQAFLSLMANTDETPNEEESPTDIPFKETSNRRKYNDQS